MNYFEDKPIEIYQITTSDDTNDYGETTETKTTILKCKADIQPVNHDIVEKEFGKVENATYQLWCNHKNISKIKKDQLVEFNVCGELKSFEIKAIKYWDDFAEFVVVDIKRNIQTENFEEEIRSDEEEDDIYG